jgi:hypothetical protein
MAAKAAQAPAADDPGARFRSSDEAGANENAAGARAEAAFAKPEAAVAKAAPPLQLPLLLLLPPLLVESANSPAGASCSSSVARWPASAIATARDTSSSGIVDTCNHHV